MNRAFLAPCLIALAAAGCATRREPAPAPRARPAPAASGSVSQQMHANFGAIRDIHRALIVDDLATAKVRARDLARVPEHTGSKEWDDAARFLRGQSERLVAARDANQARSLSTETATFCADCHMFRARPSDFRPDPLPADDGSMRAAMARHAWAADTMWLGIIAPSTDLWRDGLAEMASVPRLSAQGERAREVEFLRARLEALASRSGDLRGQGDRAARLAEVMDVCAACHALTR